ncbi:MAG: hypothetical protein P1V20_30660 [Verrucomicrobiales bacterium]|nr:hypothetical protein [Verrucomicrobiales bacterium]
MIRLFSVLLVALAGIASGQDEVAAVSNSAPVNKPGPAVVGTKMKSPPVSEIVRIDPANAFFLDTMGQLGVARFTPELDLIGWEYYSLFQWQEARHIVVGRNLSIVSGSPNELTQAFDTDKDGRLDFFQDMISEWPGKAEGATISCGPVADQYGRLLFAVAPREGAGEGASVSTLFAWNPGGQTLTSLATSSLPIAEMAVSKDGLLAAWIQLPSYTEGYYISFADLPAFNRKKPDEQPANPPALLPNMIIPASMTDFKPIGQLCFAREGGKEKLFITSPEANRLIEMVPEKVGKDWGGAVSVRASFDEPIYAVELMDEGKILLGGKAGFQPLEENLEAFRFRELRFAPDALEIDFTRPVDRIRATAEEAGVQLAIIPLEGELAPFEAPRPLVESDGKTVVLKLPELPGKAIIKIDAPDLVSEDGDPIVFPSLFYTLNRPKS